MWPFIIILVLLAFNGFFVALEFALVGSRSSRLEPLAEGGDRSAVRALGAMRDLNAQLAGAQLGITIASLLLGMIGEPAIAHVLETPIGLLPKVPDGWVHPIAAVIGLLIIVFAHMVFGEMVPKNITLSRPETTLRLLTGPNRPYLVLARPFVTVLNLAANAGVRLFGVEPRDELPNAHTSQELAALVAASKEGGVIPDTAAAILSGVLDFGGQQVRSMMVPLESISTVSASATALEAEQLVAASPHTRLIVVGDAGFEDVRGFLHSKDLLGLDRTAMSTTTVAEITRMLPSASVDSTVEPVMLSMQASGVHITQIIDPSGGLMAGIITLDDLLRELLTELTGERSDHRS